MQKPNRHCFLSTGPHHTNGGHNPIHIPISNCPKSPGPFSSTPKNPPPASSIYPCPLRNPRSPPSSASSYPLRKKNLIIIINFPRSKLNPKVAVMRLLYSNPNLTSSTAAAASAAAAPPQPLAVDSDVVVILAALLCALICVVGLALVARCAWIRRGSGPGSNPIPPPSKGLKKKALRALPRQAFKASAHGRLGECPICLGEFVDGDEIRILPQCGHGFHVGCVDTWLGAHSSCPSCRTVLVVAAAPAAVRCQKCGASSTAEGGREGGDVNRFLP